MNVSEFEKLVRKISPKLKGIAFRLNGHSRFYNNDDLYQEALLELWKDFLQGGLVGKNESYILQGCYYHLKNYIRKESDKVVLIGIEGFFEGEDEQAQSLDLEDPKDYIGQMRVDLLEDELYRILEPKERDIVELSLMGMTVREIGSLVGMSHVSVVKMKERIRQKCLKIREELL